MKDSNMRKTPQQIAQAIFSLLFIPASLVTETGHEQQPLMFMLGTDGKPEIMPMAGRVDGPEDAMRFHRYLAQQSDVAASCLISEAYVAKLPIDDPRCAEVMSGKLRPQDVEDRGEAIIFDVRVGPSRFMAVCDIDRSGETPSLSMGELVAA